MKPDQRVRLGIIGLGSAGFSQYQAARSLPEMTVAAVAEPKLRPEITQDINVPVYADWRHMIAKEALDAISICLPHHLHLEATLAAFAAGRHVLLEKPLAHTVADARRIVAAARASRRTLMLEMTHRFHPSVRVGQELVRSGRLGKIYAVEDRIVSSVGDEPARGWLFQREYAGGGVALTNGIHILDRIAWVCGQPLRFHDGLAGWSHQLGDVEDTATMQLSLADGTPVCVLAAWLRSEVLADDELTIYGSRGTLRIWVWRGWRLESTDGTMEEHSRMRRGRRRAHVGMCGALAEFAAAIRERRPATPSGEDVLPAQELIEQFYKRVRGHQRSAVAAAGSRP